MDGGDGSTTMWIYWIPLNCTLKNGYDGKLCYVYFNPLKKGRKENKSSVIR